MPRVAKMVPTAGTLRNPGAWYPARSTTPWLSRLVYTPSKKQVKCMGRVRGSGILQDKRKRLGNGLRVDQIGGYIEF